MNRYTFESLGVKYSRYSERGRQVWQAIAMYGFETAISVFLSVGIASLLFTSQAIA